MVMNKVNNIWIAKSSIMGHGFNIKELVSQMDVKSKQLLISGSLKRKLAF